MATYLEQHPGPIAQWRTVRRNGGAPTGTTVIHTYECPHTWSLEQGARGIAQRSDRPASYHCLAGDGSGTDVLQLAPWMAETWHETSTNNWAVGISMLTYAGAWQTIPRASADNLVRSAAHAAYLYATWLKATRGITIPARRITRAQALARQPGFIGHGEIDVGRRTDPGAQFDWALFLTEYARLTAQEDDMPLNAQDLDQVQVRVNHALVSDIIRGTEFRGVVKALVGGAVLAAIPAIAKAVDATVDDEEMLQLIKEQQARNVKALVPAITAAVVAAIPTGSSGGAADLATIQAAAAAAIREVLGSLD